MNDAANPFQPPKADVLLPESNRPMDPASKGRRFGTFVVDYVGVTLFGGLVGGLVGLFLGGDAVDEALDAAPDIVFGAVLLLLYYGFFEGLWARTPGKLVFGTVVVDVSGGRPSFGQVLGRTLCRFIPFEAFTFFGEWGLHDKLPKTRVVMARGRAAGDKAP